MTQGIQEQVRTLPAIEAERHFFAVGLEMLGADLVPCSRNSALQQGECGFNRVCVDLSAVRGIDAEAVLDSLVLDSNAASNSFVERRVVSEQNLRVFGKVLADKFFERAAF